jgi:hypothetical protein
MQGQPRLLDMVLGLHLESLRLIHRRQKLQDR